MLISKETDTFCFPVTCLIFVQKRCPQRWEALEGSRASLPLSHKVGQGLYAYGDMVLPSWAFQPCEGREVGCKQIFSQLFWYDQVNQMTMVV